MINLTPAQAVIVTVSSCSIQCKQNPSIEIQATYFFHFPATWALGWKIRLLQPSNVVSRRFVG